MKKISIFLFILLFSFSFLSLGNCENIVNAKEVAKREKQEIKERKNIQKKRDEKKKKDLQKIIDALGNVKVQSVRIAIIIDEDLSATGSLLTIISGLKNSDKLDKLLRKANKNIRKQARKFKKAGLKVGELSFGSTSDMYMIKTKVESKNILKIPAIISKREPVGVFVVYIKEEKKVDVAITPKEVFQMLSPFIPNLEVSIKVDKVKKFNCIRKEDDIMIWEKEFLFPSIEFSFKAKEPKGN